MSSKVFNWSDDYDYVKQKKCKDCNTVYDLTPKYEYDYWEVGHYGCTTPKQYVTGYKDDGCPYCKEKRKKTIKDFIEQINKTIHKCPVCNNGCVYINSDKYYIGCNCIKTVNYTKDYTRLPNIIKVWNQIIKS